MEEPPKRKKIDRSLLIALIALLINVITVTVYLYQSMIMREQQYASAWPYLEWQSVYNQEDGYSLFVSNNGVGPAIIKNVEIMFDGQQMDNLKSVYDRILETSEYPYLSARVANRVIPAGDQIRLMQINDPMMSELAYYRLDTADFRFRICYESIYGEGWTSSGHEVEVSSCP